MGVASGCATVLVAVWLVALIGYDIRQRRLPNFLTLPGAVLILAAATTYGRGAPALLGALGLMALYLAVHLVAPAGMGAGDVKLALGVGALTGAFGVGAWAFAAVAAPVLTTLWAVAARGPERSVPHGPSMCLAAAVAAALELAAA